MINKVILINDILIPGILYFLLQVILSDLISLGICYIELSYFLNRKWTTYHELCSLYMGLETFTSTALIYFLCTINLHAISTSNLALGLRVVMKNKEENTNFIMYDDVREESSSETYDTLEYKRSLTIDYSRRLKSKIGVLLPALFIWIVAGSVSIPSFIFSDVVKTSGNTTLCGVRGFYEINSLFGYNLIQILITNMRIFLPTGLLLITFFVLILKKFQIRNYDLPDIEEDPRNIIKFSLILTLSYFIFQIQRLYSSVLLEVIDYPMINNKFSHFSEIIGITLILIFYLLTCLRPLIYILVHKNLNQEFKNQFKRTRK